MSGEGFSRRRFLEAGIAASTALLVEAKSTFASTAQGPTLLITHEAFRYHLTNGVERPSRMTAIDAVLAAPAFAELRRAQAPLREDCEAAVLRVHGKDHWAQIAAAANDPTHLPKTFGHDTVMSEGTFEAARRAVGAGLLAIDHVMDRTSGVKNAFCQVRPPGHHAEQNRIMGFCFFNNVAIATAYARAAHEVERVAIVDFDVHHGNGTQQIFYEDRNTFYGSTHQMPLFPGTGAVTETGMGNIFNAPLSADDGGARFKEAMGERILSALDAFRPELILISAGFDAHEGDPLASLKLQDEDFAWITLKLMEAAQKHCGGRIVSFLEGGYRLDTLASAASAHVGALMQA